MTDRFFKRRLPVTAVWGTEHPEALEGADLLRPATLVGAFCYPKNRIPALATLPVASLYAVSRRVRLTEISQVEGATCRRAEAA